MCQRQSQTREIEYLRATLDPRGSQRGESAGRYSELVMAPYILAITHILSGPLCYSYHRIGYQILRLITNKSTMSYNSYHPGRRTVDSLPCRHENKLITSQVTSYIQTLRAYCMKLSKMTFYDGSNISLHTVKKHLR